MSKKSKQKRALAEAERLATREEINKRAASRASRSKNGGRTPPRVKKERKKLPRWVYATVAAVLAIAIIVPIVWISLANRRVDFVTANLSKYVLVPEGAYKGLTYTTEEPPVTEEDVEWEITKLLAENKGAAEYSGERRRWVNISAGDMLEIYYRGYRIVDGVRDYFAGGCNLDDLVSGMSQAEIEAAYIEIGGNTILFEPDLVGINTVDYATLGVFETGSVGEGDILFLTYSIITPDNSNGENISAYIDLSTDEADRLFGEGFSEFIVGRNIGEILSESFVSPAADGEGDSVYYDITVVGAFRRSEAPVLTIPTRFPDNYSEESLRGVTAYFDVYVMGGIEYSVPDFDESFIYDTLKETEESLADYKGEGAVAKYRAKITKQLIEAREDRIDAAAVEHIWSVLLAASDIRRLPKKEIRVFYDGYIEQLEEEFSYYSSYYSDFGAFVRECYAIPEDEDWEEYVWNMAKDALVEKIIFYIVARREGIYPTDAECLGRAEELESSIVNEYLEYVGCTPDKYKTESEYEVAKALKVNELLDYYGEDYFATEAYYEYVMERLLRYVTVREVK